MIYLLLQLNFIIKLIHLLVFYFFKIQKFLIYLMVFLHFLLAVLLITPGCFAQQCDINCQACGPNNTCLNCVQGYFLINEYTCRQCPTHCTTCTQDSNYHPVCTSCSQTHLLMQQNYKYCFPCLYPCRTCLNDPGSCITCQDGFKLQVGFSSACSPNTVCNTISGCQQCSSDNGLTVCTRCQKGLYLFGGGCQICPNNCAECEYAHQNNWEQIRTFWNQSRNAVFEIVRSNSMNASEGNWTEQRWNSTPWTSEMLPSFSLAELDKIRRWIFAYTLLKSSMSHTQSSSMPLLLYYMLPLIQPILSNPSQPHSYVVSNSRAPYGLDSWQNLSDSLNAYPRTVKQWNPVQLYQWVATVGREGVVCLNCSVGQYLQVGKCWACKGACTTCINQNFCTSCNYGYYLSNFRCQKCPQDCPTCKSPTSCYTCPFYLSLYNNTCISQSCTNPNCRGCSSPPLTSSSASNPSFCLACTNDFSPYPTSNGTCYQCPPACVICAENGICLQCIMGYTVRNGTCLDCGSPNCLECTYDEGMQSAFCYRCELGFVLSPYQPNYRLQDIILRCQPCQPACLECLPSFLFFCTKCAAGYYPKLGTCTRCPNQCNICQIIGGRLVCRQMQKAGTIVLRESINGNFTNGTTIIKNCSGQCKICSDIWPKVCQVCHIGFFVDKNGQCRQCPSSCRSCFNSTRCRQCQLSGLQPTCSACSSECLSCSSAASTCTNCPPSSFVQPQSQSCPVCRKGCQKCHSNLKCVMCHTGHSLNKNRQCIPCLTDNCQQCGEDVSICDWCQVGYKAIQRLENRVINGSVQQVTLRDCQECPQGCFQCSFGSCTFCLQGYRLNVTADKCTLQCLFPCLQCYKNYTCAKCQPGYDLIGSSCVPNVTCNPCQSCLAGTEIDSSNPNLCLLCPSNCQSCLNGICSLCFDGFYLSSSSVCTKCPNRCLKCVNAEYCISCSTPNGYVAETHISNTYPRCIRCKEQCITCEIYNYRCTSCKVGYRLKGKRCISSLIVAYLLQMSGTVPEYTLNFGARLEQFKNQVNTKTNIIQERHIIIYVRKGSVIINGSIQADNLSQASQIKNDLSSLTLDNITLLSRQIVILQNSQVIEDSTQGTGQSTNGSNVSIIVGVVIGSIVLVSILAITAVWGVKNWRNNANNVDYAGQNIPRTGHLETVSSNGQLVTSV